MPKTKLQKIQDKLTKLKIDYDENETDESVLEALLPTDEKVDKITIGSPMDLRPVNLPLVVKVPENASSAQKEYAKILNGYAYQNPEKFAKKKDVFFARLKSLEGKEVVVGDQKLSLNKSTVSFAFIKGADGKEYYNGEQIIGK